MPNLPAQYAWLADEPGPKMLRAALDVYGLRETPGPGNNPVIMGWAKELDLKAYNADSIPWCGLGMGHFAHVAGKTLPKAPLWARDWLNFGVRPDRAMLGDVLVFGREGGGHVALYVGEDGDCYHCLGCNQSDAVTITRIRKGRLLGVRRPIYNNQPENVRVIYLKPSGSVSRNEA